MSTVDFRMTVALVGVRSWEIDSTETAPDTLPRVTDGLRITRSVPETDIKPTQPDPATAAFGIVAESITDLDNVILGAPVAIHYYSPATSTVPLESFHGRITDLVARPHPAGVILDVTAVDYLADLAERFLMPGVITHTDSGRVLDDIFDAATTAGWTSLGWTGPYVIPPTEAFNAAELIEVLLRQWVIGAIPSQYRAVLKPVIVGDVLHSYARSAQGRIPPSGGVEIPAAQVDVAGAFTCRKFSQLGRIAVKYPGGALELTSGSGYQPGTSIETTLDGSSTFAPHTAVANFYLPNVVVVGASDLRWSADTFVWQLKAAPAGSYLPALQTLVTVAGIDPRWGPRGVDFTGVLSGYTLTVDRLRPTLSFELRDAIEA